MSFKIFIGLLVFFLVTPCIAQQEVSSSNAEYSKGRDSNSESEVEGYSERPDLRIYEVTELDIQAEFQGGLIAFNQYVMKNMRLPDFKNSMRLKMYVSWTIEKDGSMTNIKMLQDPGYGLGEEAIRVLKLIETKWEPGRFDGKAVRSRMALPIVINVK